LAPSLIIDQDWKKPREASAAATEPLLFEAEGFR
jgi:hypothetical protein